LNLQTAQSNMGTPSNNKNPGSNPAAASASGASENRGLPYYEKLRRELRDTLQRKRLMDKSMVLFTRPAPIRKKTKTNHKP
jgi:chromatin modification-related protein EAF6